MPGFLPADLHAQVNISEEILLSASAQRLAGLANAWLRLLRCTEEKLAGKYQACMLLSRLVRVHVEGVENQFSSSCSLTRLAAYICKVSYDLAAWDDNCSAVVG
jgi:hypothetical protein